MSTPKSEFLKVILDRGYLHQCTDWEALDALLAKQSVVDVDQLSFTLIPASVALLVLMSARPEPTS